MEEKDKLIQELLLEVKEIKLAITSSFKKSDTDKWLDNTDVQELLHISTRTLQRLRTSGMLKYSKVNGKIYYRLSDINTMLEQNQAD